MSSTISVNYMSGMVNSYSSMYSQRKTDASVLESMSDTIDKLTSEKENVAKSSKTGIVSKEDMTMEEYKQYISDQISKFRIDPSRSGDQYSINISDAGFEAMKNDPEYENWVLDYIKRDMAVAAPGWYTAMGGPSAYCILNFGATKEERTGNMFSAGYMNGKGTGIFNSYADKSFWTKRSEQKKIQERTNKKAAEKKELEEEWIQEAAAKRRAYTDFLNGKAMIKTSGASELSNIFSKPTDTKIAGIISAYEAGTIEGGII